MPAPSASTIARQAANHTRYLQPETAVVSRGTRTPNDSGGWTDGAATTVVTTTARIASAGGNGGRNAEGRIEVTDQWWLTFPAGTDVRTGDVVTINARTFNVQGPDGARSQALATRVVADEVT